MKNILNVMVKWWNLQGTVLPVQYATGVIKEHLAVRTALWLI